MAPFQAFCRLQEPFTCWPKSPMMFRLIKEMSILLAGQKSLDLLRMQTLVNFGFIWACNSDSPTKTLYSLKWAMKALVLCTCVTKCCRTQYVAFLTLRRAMFVSQRLQWAKTISFFSFHRWLDTSSLSHLCFHDPVYNFPKFLQPFILVRQVGLFSIRLLWLNLFVGSVLLIVAITWRWGLNLNDFFILILAVTVIG